MVNDLRRKRPSRQPKDSVLLLVEGKITEKLYFKGMCRKLSLRSITVEGPSGVPITAVEAALSRRIDFDEVWCVFDVDDHPRLKEAIHRAAQGGVQVALSNPSFEIFLLLHFEYFSKPCTRAQVRRALKKHLPEYEKHIDFEIFWGAYKAGLINNLRLEKWHQSSGTTGRPPSTGAFRLAEKLHEMAKAK
jgi:hypothetical protein